MGCMLKTTGEKKCNPSLRSDQGQDCEGPVEELMFSKQWGDDYLRNVNGHTVLLTENSKMRF